MTFKITYGYAFMFFKFYTSHSACSSTQMRGNLPQNKHEMEDSTLFSDLSLHIAGHNVVP